MFKSVIYKEWLKTRWLLIALTLLGVLAMGIIFLKVQHAITFNGANQYWYLLLFQNLQYFKTVKFIPVVIGLLTALAQYIPEISSKRIKLTFHLPINENKIMLMMLAYGIFSLLISFAILFVVFIIVSNNFLPSEIVKTGVISVIPWYLAGFAAYFMGGLITLEAIWKYRVFYILASAAFIVFFFEPAIAGAYATLNVKLAVLTLLISLSLTFSAYRFRKGEM